LGRAFAATPGVIWIPLAVMWFGIGDSSAIVATVFGIFFQLLIQRTRGYVQNKNANSRGVLSTALTAYRLAFLMVIAAEFVGSNHGLGYVIMAAQDTELLWTAILTTGFIALTLEAIVILIRTRILHA